eukprot:gnl/Ergobibamus_cyprinoides/894.p2 GENE.gnl/Ergobibamus_cyprinoides/894~~gnl/Ergobibamus_cyprinoides/894.p2  ORF type:complete len:269 (+),score=78.73 gnl/Ergobibamus_cyprinoides/894:485-1291(+)
MWIGTIVVVFSVVCLVGLYKVQAQLVLSQLIKVTYLRLITAQQALGMAFFAGYAPDYDADEVSELMTSYTDSLEDLHAEVLRELDAYGDHYPEVVEQHYSSSCLRLISDECTDLMADIGPFAEYRSDVTKGLHMLMLEYIAALRAYNDAGHTQFDLGSGSDYLQRIIALEMFDGSGGLLGSQKILRTYLTEKISADKTFLTVGGVTEAICVLAMFFGFFTLASAKVRAQRAQMMLLLSTIPADVLFAVPDLQQEIYGIGSGTEAETEE